MNLTYGERTGACMRIGGAGKSLYNFCLKDENGFLYNMTMRIYNGYLYVYTNTIPSSGEIIIKL